MTASFVYDSRICAANEMTLFMHERTVHFVCHECPWSQMRLLHDVPRVNGAIFLSGFEAEVEDDRDVMHTQ